MGETTYATMDTADVATSMSTIMSRRDPSQRDVATNEYLIKKSTSRDVNQERYEESGAQCDTRTRHAGTNAGTCPNEPAAKE